MAEKEFVAPHRFGVGDEHPRAVDATRNWKVRGGDIERSGRVLRRRKKVRL
jgi:hypothetical protein